VFGVSDGLVSNVGLILGVAGASPEADVVRVAGLAGLLAGAISMAAGEYNSMKVQAELLEREIELERAALAAEPEAEADEYRSMLEARGFDAGTASDLTDAVMADPELALLAHAREELGIDPTSVGSPRDAALASFGAFALGAVVPLVPWFFGGGTAAVIASLVLAVVAAIVIGAVTARLTDRPAPRIILRQLAFTILPAIVTYAIGSAIGLNV
jgi:VIT1/CCC1 family predicted Fe2+/Mn2+ transporter